MLQIDVSKYDKQRWKDIKIGEHHFRFRELGAGEMLAYTQKAERATKLSNAKERTEKNTQELAKIFMEIVQETLDMFQDPSGEDKVAKVLGKYEALDLFDIVNEIREQVGNGSQETDSQSYP